MKTGILLILIDLAKRMFELCHENKITERCLNYLIKQTKVDITYKELLNLLLLKWSDRKLILTSHHKRQTFDSKQLDNDFCDKKDNNTILIDLFKQIEGNKRSMVRKLAAYVLL
jgi:hypothetical protein